METIKSLNTYNTDIFASYGIGQNTVDIDTSFEEILKYAIRIQAYIIVKPSRGKYWYIKGINRNKTYEEIKLHIENNLIAKYKENSKLWLLDY
jgi:hypothetical protein